MKSDTLNIYCNGEINYTIKGKHAKVSVIWDYKAPREQEIPTIVSCVGQKVTSSSNKVAENYKPTLYVVSKEGENFESNLKKALESIQVNIQA